MFPVYEDRLDDLKKHLEENAMNFKTQKEINNMLGELAYRNFFECVKYMVEEKGADVTAKREDNGAPLGTRPAGLGFAKILEYFVEKGANLDEIDEFFVRNKRGGLLGVAFESGKLDMVKYIVDKRGLPEGENLQKILLESATDMSILKYLEENGISCVFKSPESGPATNPIHISCNRSNVDGVKFWLERGADPNALDENGQTPLHLSIGKRREIVNLLLNAKDININTKNSAGDTPALAAIKNPWGGAEVLEALLVAGADTTGLLDVPNLSASTLQLVEDWVKPDGKKRTSRQISSDARKEKKAAQKAKKPKTDVPDVYFHVLEENESRTKEWTGEGEDEDEDMFTPIPNDNIRFDLSTMEHPSAAIARELANKAEELLMQSEADVKFLPFPYEAAHKKMTPVQILTNAFGGYKGLNSRSAGQGQNFFSTTKICGASVSGPAASGVAASKYMKDTLDQTYKIKTQDADPGTSLIFICGKDLDHNALVGVYTFSVCT